MQGKLRAFVFFALSTIASLPIFASVTASTRREDGAFVTEGWIDLGDLSEDDWRALGDFKSYRTWALEGLDGKDPVSADFIGIFTDMIYSDPGIMKLEYDVNLPWPLGSKGHLTDFKVSETRAGRDGRVAFVLSSPNFATESAKVELKSDEIAAKGRLLFRIEVRFSWFLDRFFTMSGYKSSVEWRILRVVENFETYRSRIALAHHK
jgi:hypothetical protein